MYFDQDGSSKRDSSAASVTVSPTLTDTNETYSAKVCALVTSTTSYILIMGSANQRFQVPACVVNATSATNFYFSFVIVSSLAPFPASLTSLTLSYVTYTPEISESPTSTPMSTPMSSSPSSQTPSTSTRASGFNPSDGSLDWTSVWNLFPGIVSLSIYSSTGLIGNAPSYIPPALSDFGCYNNPGITGSIPSTLYSRFAAGRTYISMYGNSLTGTIPPALFAPLQGKSVSSILLDLSSNQLTGGIPSDWTLPLNGSGISNLFLYLNNNPLGGTIPTGNSLIPLSLTTNTYMFGLRLSNTSLQGTIPNDFLANISNTRSIELLLDNNHLTGSLPTAMWGSNVWTPASHIAAELQISFAGNKLSGTIPQDLFSRSLTRNKNFTQIGIALDRNALTGTVPRSFFSATTSTFKKDIESPMSADRRLEGGKLSLTKDQLGVLEGAPLDGTTLYSPNVTTGLIFTLSSNLLTGTVPDNLLDNIIGGNTSLNIVLAFQNNSFEGQFPESILQALPNPAGGKLTVNMSSNRFHGAPPSTCWTSTLATSYYFANNLLNGTMPSWSGCAITVADISNNRGLTGTLPSSFFNNSVFTFVASNTSLYGPVPSVVSSRTLKVDMSLTNIDFCSSPWTVSTPASGIVFSCVLQSTSACDCVASYSACTTCPQPIAAPLPQGCPEKTRPSAEFTCINGSWIAPFSNETVLVIPPGAGPVIVDGNITSTAIVFNTISTTLIVKGCASNLTSIQVELTPEEIAKIGGSKMLYNLLSLGNASNCNTSLSDVGLVVKTKGSCKKVKTEKVLSDEGNTLGAFFTLDSSGCNLWWIILVSVIAAVIFLGAIAVAVIGSVYLKKRTKREKSRLADLDRRSERG